MSERAAVLESVGYFETDHLPEWSGRLESVLDCMPQAGTYDQERNLRAADTPFVLKSLGIQASERLNQPINMAILKRYEKDWPEDSEGYWQQQTPARLAGRLALVFLSGRANFFAVTGPANRTKLASCTSNTVIYMDATVPYYVTPPLTSEPLQMVLLGHDVTKSAR